MLNAAEAYQKGLDGGLEIARRQLSEAFGFEIENFGVAVAEVVFLQRKLKRLQDDLEELKLEKADWK